MLMVVHYLWNRCSKAFSSVSLAYPCKTLTWSSSALRTRDLADCLVKDGAIKADAALKRREETINFDMMIDRIEKSFIR